MGFCRSLSGFTERIPKRSEIHEISHSGSEEKNRNFIEITNLSAHDSKLCPRNIFLWQPFETLAHPNLRLVASPPPWHSPASASRDSSSLGVPAAPPAATHLELRAPSTFRRPLSSTSRRGARGEALWERESAGSGSLGVVFSESAAWLGELRWLGRLRARRAVVRVCVCGSGTRDGCDL